MFKKVLIVTILFLILSSITAFAQEEKKDSPSITIAPSILDLTVTRNQTLEEKITIKNDFNVPMPIKVESNDYTQDEEGIPDYSLDNSDWSPKQWIVIEPKDFILESYGVREVTIKITIPDYAELGSHFATILFKPVLPPEYFEADSAHVIPYIGAIVSLSVKGEELEHKDDYLALREFKREESEEDNEEQFYTKVYNEDVYYHKVSGEIIIKNIFNKEVAAKSIDEVTLFPQTLRSLESFFGQDLPFGRYRAELKLSGGEGTVEKSIVFWENPTMVEIVFIIIRTVLLILIVGTTVFIVVKRRNLKGAIKVLFKDKD